jgi:hypothetical protein
MISAQSASVTIARLLLRIVNALAASPSRAVAADELRACLHESLRTRLSCGIAEGRQHQRPPDTPPPVQLDME